MKTMHIQVITSDPSKLPEPLMAALKQGSSSMGGSIKDLISLAQASGWHATLILSDENYGAYSPDGSTEPPAHLQGQA